MAFSELERRSVERALDAFLGEPRPPPEIRAELDIEYRISGQTIGMFELRPDWRERDRTTEPPVARIRYVRSRATWKIYWMRKDLRWHGYEPMPQMPTIDKALQVVNEDRYFCFFG